jgi:hypothetical protein
MTQRPSAASFPWLPVLGIFVLALVGVVLLGLMVMNLTGGQQPAATPTAAITLAATQAAALPTTTAAPPPSATLEPTLPPTEPPTEAGPTAEPTEPPRLNITQPANVRSGPGLTFQILGGLNVGETPAVMGRDSSAQWYAVQFEASTTGIGWVSNLVSTFDGDTATSAPANTAAPGNTAAPTNTAPPAATNTPAASAARGIVGNHFSVEKTSVAVNEDIWFNFQVTNSSQADVQYGALAAHTDVGFTAQSWTAETLKAGQSLTWRDHININTAGTYQIYLGICFADKNACLTGGAAWERLSPSISVTVN